MNQKVKLKDVAAACKVSTGTVSLALNNSPLVNEATKALVQQTAQSMGYIPNELARALVKQRSKTIGVVVPDLANPFYATFLGELNRAVTQRDYRLTISLSDNSTQKENSIVEQMLRNNAEGIIIVPVNRDTAAPAYVKRLSALEIPFLFAVDRYEGSEALCVSSHCGEGMESMLRYAIQKGYQSIAYLSGDASVPSLKARLDGYTRVMQEHGLPLWVIPVESIDYGGAQRAVKQCLAKLPQVFVCPNDMMALGAINALQTAGLRVPEDCAVTGFDNVIFSEVSSVPITTVSQDIFQMAQQAAEAIFALIQGEKPQNPLPLLPTQLVIRKSC